LLLVNVDVNISCVTLYKEENVLDGISFFKNEMAAFHSERAKQRTYKGDKVRGFVPEKSDLLHDFLVHYHRELYF
jgi:hypothetical protein